jgi:prevent-host-death family protein
MTMRRHTTETIMEATKGMDRVLARVEKGETIVITRRGEPVAKLVPIAAVPKFDPDRVRKAVAGLREFAKKRAKLPPGMTIRDMIYDGRR